MPSGLASQIMNSSSLNQAPSPAQPQTVPSNDIANRYAQLLAIATDLMQIETDGIRKMSLAENIEFYDRAVRASIVSSSSGGAPAQMPQPVPAAAPPQAATGGPPGMPPPSPMPPGAGGLAPQGVPTNA